MELHRQESTTSLLLRNLVFTVLQPGLVAGVIPYYILEGVVNLDEPWHFYTYGGLLLFAIGLIVMLRCILQFALEGKGTLSPVDPTKKLVIRGFYRHSRNPMYVGVMMMLIGEAIMMRSTSLWIYAAIVFTAFNLFIMFHEEPRLRRDFGDEYLLYCKKVGRWF
jgi:protein-S-isoprenylcysteine O-methyltransferase Ste14